MASPALDGVSGLVRSADFQPEELAVLRRAARILWPRWGEWAHDEWKRLNETYFGNELKPCGILFGLTPHGRALAFFSPADRTITLHPSLLDPKSASPWRLGEMLGERFCSDGLLHEMTHQGIHQRGGRQTGYSSHDCQEWVDEVNRISPLLGLDGRAALVRQRRVRGTVKWVVEPGCLTREMLAEWPHSVRPEGYYSRSDEAEQSPRG
jgi:hypothetical protein